MLHIDSNVNFPLSAQLTSQSVIRARDFYRIDDDEIEIWFTDRCCILEKVKYQVLILIEIFVHVVISIKIERAGNILSGAGLEIRNRFYRLYKADMLRESKWVVEGGWNPPLIAKFMGPIWGPRGADRTQVGPMLVTWTFLSGTGPRSWVAEIWRFGWDPRCWSHQWLAGDMSHYIYMYFI